VPAGHQPWKALPAGPWFCRLIGLIVAVHAAVEKLPGHFGRGKLGFGVASKSIASRVGGEPGGVVDRPETPSRRRGQARRKALLDCVDFYRPYSLFS